MKTEIKSVLKPALVLFAICLVTTALLALTNLFAAAKIGEREKQMISETRKKVLGDAVSFEEVNHICARGVGAEGETVGYVFTVAEKGYGDDMQVMVGVSDGKVTGVRVLSHSETAGLGAKAAEKEFLDQYNGLSENAEVGRNIDKITGATISSKAVTSAVNRALDEYKKITEGQHG
ncbi:MAG TPA: FMN-binding protein [Bacillota bacterium]|nr:FMN-binding protein [Bacillota bacterium]